MGNFDLFLLTTMRTFLLSVPATADDAAEAGREEEIQIEQPVKRADKRTCDQSVQPAEKAVSPLCQPAEQPAVTLPCAGNCEGERDGETTDKYCAVSIAGMHKTVHKGLHHISIGERDGNFHCQIARFAEMSDTETGQPPMCLADAE